MLGLAVLISSRKMVPASDCMNLPSLSWVAPVNAPATWPKSSLSSSVSGSAPQATSTKGLSRRPLRRWMARAMSDLPVPLSPVIRTVALVSATLSTISKTRFMRWSLPTTFSRPKRMSSCWRRTLVFFEHAALAHGALEGHFQLGVDQWLGEEIEGAASDGVHRHFDGAIAGDEDHRGGRDVSRQWARTSKPSPSGRRTSQRTTSGVLRRGAARADARSPAESTL